MKSPKTVGLAVAVMSGAAPAGKTGNVGMLMCHWSSSCPAPSSSGCSTSTFGDSPLPWHFHHCDVSTKETHDRGENSMKAIVVTAQAARTAGMKLVERPEPQAAIN